MDLIDRIDRQFLEYNRGQHGEWIESPLSELTGSIWYECSECGTLKKDIIGANYCSRCGADMRKTNP